MLKKIMITLLMTMLMAQANAADKMAGLKTQIETMLPGIKVESLSLMKETGLYEAVLNGEVVYFTQDLKYIIQGEVTSMATRENLTETKKTGIRQSALAKLDESELIVYEPKKTAHTITVFTDIDCGYCRKLHSQMQQYTDLGIRVRYMAFPRAGIDSESYQKAVSVWCAKDRHKAMDEAKAGKKLAEAECANPVASQYQLGGSIGVRGTPALFLESGEMLPGYVPPQRLKKMLDQRAQSAKL
jgi:thiol:disulfide interchange protein DsbC